MPYPTIGTCNVARRPRDFCTGVPYNHHVRDGAPARDFVPYRCVGADTLTTPEGVEWEGALLDAPGSVFDTRAEFVGRSAGRCAEVA